MDDIDDKIELRFSFEKSNYPKISVGDVYVAEDTRITYGDFNRSRYDGVHRNKTCLGDLSIRKVRKGW
tara:strand:- start:189 stop:392 length:204 start_codon:yes stop_codon:yes gene_type:complete